MTNKLTFIDLFCGAGGMSEGFENAGYNCILANDYDEQAIDTFKYNHKGVTTFCGDIKEISATELMQAANCKQGDIDVICGGPPCQGFSLAGPRIAEDPRNKLFLEFVRMTREIKPKVVLLENVPGLISMQKGAVRKAILSEFSKIGYECVSGIINAADFGVPQMRNRFIMIGVLNQYIPSLPSPTHGNNINQMNLFHKLQPYVTSWEALSDLPYVDQGEGAEELLHSSDYQNDYQLARRGHRTPNKIYNHRATKHSESVQHRYALIPEGCNNSSLPDDIRTKKNNVFKMDRNKPSRTITCNHRTDLLHPTIPRGTTVREAARLQSFDDDYRFFGNLTRKAKWVTQDDQVGNAVPPLLAKALATHIKSVILGLESALSG